MNGPPLNDAPLNDGGRSHRAAETASRIVFWIAAFLFLAYVFLKAYELAATDAPLPALKIDFLAFWAAAKLALAGEALSAFDPDTLAAASGVPQEQTGVLWLYPPAFLVLLAPLGALRFWAEWPVCVMGSAVLPAFTTPGQLTKNGTRMPPS